MVSYLEEIPKIGSVFWSAQVPNRLKEVFPTFVIGNGVENFVDFAGVVDFNADGVRALKTVRYHHAVHVRVHELRVNAPRRFELKTNIKILDADLSCFIIKNWNQFTQHKLSLDLKKKKKKQSIANEFIEMVINNNC